MKIILIVPAVGDSEDNKYIRSWQMEPLTMAVIAAATPSNIEIKLYDDRIERINFKDTADLVAISVETYTARRAYQIATVYKNRDIPVVMGGYHATLITDEVAGHADFVITGEIEASWQDFLNDFKSGKAKKIYTHKERPSISGIKPRREIFEKKNYLPISLVETTRGCRFACKFCSITSFYCHTCNYRPASEVAAEIERLNKKYVFLVDDNIVSDKEQAGKLFDELAPLKVKWVSQGDINVFSDETILKKMKNSGCEGMLIGFESLDSKNLQDMGKSWNVMKSYDESMKKIHDSGISVYATFIFGYDGDTDDTFKRVLDFALKQNFFMAAFNHLVPFPGTPLYKQMEEQSRLIYDKWWLSEKFRFGDVCFKPKNMSADEISEKCVEIRKAFYSGSSIIKRALDLKNNCKNPEFIFYYFMVNLMLQREVTMKRKIMLGRQVTGELA